MSQYEKVHEPVSTYIFAHKGRFKIKAFKWQGRIYRINSNNLMTMAQKGINTVYLFSVSNESGAFQLRFDTETLKWWLEEVMWDT